MHETPANDHFRPKATVGGHNLVVAGLSHVAGRRRSTKGYMNMDPHKQQRMTT